MVIERCSCKTAGMEVILVLSFGPAGYMNLAGMAHICFRAVDTTETCLRPFLSYLSTQLSNSYPPSGQTENFAASAAPNAAECSRWSYHLRRRSEDLARAECWLGRVAQLRPIRTTLQHSNQYT